MFDDWDVIATEKTLKKLYELHGVTESDIEEALANSEDIYLEDDREEHKTTPPTLWFISEIDDDKMLKVVFIPRADLRLLVIKTAYPPDENEVDIYESNR